MNIDDCLPLLERDLRVTLGPFLQGIALERMSELRTLDVPPTDEKLVDDIQQRIQDERIDTVWPACVLHKQHPMAYADGVWRCPQTREPLIPLGSLVRQSPAVSAEERARLPFRYRLLQLSLVPVIVLGAAIPLQRVILPPLIEAVLDIGVLTVIIAAMWWVESRFAIQPSTGDEGSLAKQGSRPAV